MIGLNRTKSQIATLNEDITSLIQHEYQLVRDGKDASKLAELFHEYEMSSFTSDISKNAKLLELYARTLLINGDYNDLFFLIRRYTNVSRIRDRPKMVDSS